MSTVNYTPPATVTDYLKSNKFGNFIIGPVGSGKTTGMLFRIVKMAREQRKGPDGFRRFRAIVVRNTNAQLLDTSLRSWFTWFPEGVAGLYERTNKIFHLHFDDVEAEVWFRPLDTAEDVRRLLSVEASVICFDECREIHPDIYSAATGRVGRYPSKKDGGPYKDDGSPNFGVFGSTNPPDGDTFWHELFTEPPDNVNIFFQPGGLDPGAENTDNLPDDYYPNLCEGKSSDWIDVYVNAKFGKSLSGQPVFRAFDRDVHVAKSELKPNNVAAGGLIIGFDCGLTPAAVIGQLGYDGRLLVYHSITSQGMGALRFAREKLKPILANRFPGMRSIIIIDPAGFQRAQTDERTVNDILKAEGFTVKAAKSNLPTPRIAAVDNFLTRTVDSKPLLQLDPVNCIDLVRGMAGKYRYKIKTTGEVDDRPEKSHPWSDVCDAFQYLCLHADGGNIYGGNPNTHRREIKPAPYRAFV